MINFIVEYFDYIALTLASLGFFIFEDKRNSIALLFCFTVSYIVSVIDLTYMNAYYYLVMCLFQILYITFFFAVKAKPTLITVLLIIFGYNGLSHLEYNSSLSIFYDNYILTMRLLAGLLVILTYFYGFKDGINNANNSRRNNNLDGSYWVFYWGAK